MKSRELQFQPVGEIVQGHEPREIERARKEIGLVRRERQMPAQHLDLIGRHIIADFKTNRRAWRYFQTLAPTYRRNFVVWIHTARRPETRDRRIRESIALLAAGKKLGLK